VLDESWKTTEIDGEPGRIFDGQARQIVSARQVSAVDLVGGTFRPAAR
jgi:hypothetical protein